MSKVRPNTVGSQQFSISNPKTTANGQRLSQQSEATPS